MSLDKIDAACAELQSVATVQRLKDGGDKSQALLSASNLLGWSGGGDNLSLAKDLLDGKKILAFEAGAGFEASLDDTAVAVALQKGSALVDQINEILATITPEQREELMQWAVDNQPLAE